MNTLRLHPCLPTLASTLLLLGACSSGGGGGPWPPVDDATGPVELHLHLTTQAPELRFFDRDPSEAQAREWPQQALFFDRPAGLFRAGQQDPLYSSPSGLFSQSDLAAGGYGSTLIIDNLPTGDYRLSFIRQIAYDFDMFGPPYDEDRTLNFTIPAGTSGQYVVELAATTPSLGGTGEISGRLLISGNPDLGAETFLGFYSAAQGVGGDEVAETYLIPTASAGNGRLFFRIRGLAPGEYAPFGGLDFPRDRAVYTGGLPDGNGQVTAGAAGSTPAVSLYLQGHFDLAPLDQHLESINRRALINCTVQLTGARTWTDDLVVVAEASVPGMNPSRALRFIRPEDADFSGNISLQLGNLRPGEFEVSVLRLGADNTIPPAVLAGPVGAELVELTSSPGGLGPTATAALELNL